MNELGLQDLLTPLDFEEALHFLDVLTWFPEPGPERWASYAGYVRHRAAHHEARVPADYAEVFARLTADFASLDHEPHETDPPVRRHLYSLKYDLKVLLLPDAFFSFMNMGYVTPGDNGSPLDPNDPLAHIARLGRALYERTIGDVSLTGKDVLEIGSGRGGGAGYIAATYAPRSMLGIDLSANNIAFSQRTQSAPGLRFTTGDATALPLPDECVDVVINIESAHCYPDVPGFLREVRRVLRPGGSFLFADEWWTTRLDELERAFGQSGLACREPEDITDAVLASLEILGEAYPALVAQAPPERQALWERFFGERVCRDSAESYKTGRFVFLRRRCDRVPTPAFDTVAFRDRGFTSPLRLCEPGEMAGILADVRGVLARPGPVPAPAPDAERGRLATLVARGDASPVPYIECRHLDARVIWDLCAHPTVVEAVAALLGRDLIVWRSTLIAKAAGGPEFGWHQDWGGVHTTGTEYGLEPPVQVTAWIALTRAWPANGGLRFIPGVRAVLQPATAAGPNATPLVGRHGVSAAGAESVDLQPGEFALFTDRTPHSSHPNASDEERLGLAVRYAPAFVAVRPHFEGHAVALVSGVDTVGANRLASRPT